MSVNSCCISGHLAKTPTLRFTAGGTACLSFAVAVNEARKNRQTGEWESVPSFIDVTVFGTRAEGLSKFLAKGMKVCVSGRIRQTRYEKDGETRYSVGVVADEVDVMQRREAGAQAQSAASDAEAMAAVRGLAGGNPVALYDEDIPF